MEKKTGTNGVSVAKLSANLPCYRISFVSKPGGCTISNLGKLTRQSLMTMYISLFCGDFHCHSGSAMLPKINCGLEKRFMLKARA